MKAWLQVRGLVRHLWGGPKEYDEATETWITSDGRRIPVRHMTDDHLRNTIFYLNKRYGGDLAQHGISTPAYVAEVHTLHSGPLVGMYQQYLSGSPAELFPIYDIMRREADRRQLRWYP